MKRRYSMPAKIVELLWADDEYFREVQKIKKVSSTSNFPKNDQWVDEKGFHLEFALAGYSTEDIRISVRGQTLHVCSEGMVEDAQHQLPKEDDDAFAEYARNAKPKTQKGFVVRGIARRSFSVKNMISEDFDLSKIEATMDHGLLHITVPNSEFTEDRVVQIQMRGG
jgi:HSP20 family molecular chaperone IbpA